MNQTKAQVYKLLQKTIPHLLYSKEARIHLKYELDLWFQIMNLNSNSELGKINKKKDWDKERSKAYPDTPLCWRYRKKADV